jgi:Transposase DDE domain
MTTSTMAKQLVPDEVWDAIQPLVPPKPSHPKGGRPWIEDRAVLGGIIYVLQCPGAAWGELTGANPVDRGKAGSKYHLLVDAGGIPLAVGLSAANTHDSLVLEQMVDAVPAVVGPRGRPGRPRRRPAKLHGD